MKYLLIYSLVLSTLLWAQNSSDNLELSLDYNFQEENVQWDKDPHAPSSIIATQKQGQEWRSFWVDAWNRGVFNREQIREVVQSAQSYGYNAITVQVRRRGDALYIPNLPNTEPRLSNLEKDFDVLQEFITESHKVNIEVHAWITTFLISTSTLPKSPEHVVNRHPEYLSCNSEGNKKIGEGYYLDPGHPGALKWNQQVVMDIVRNYNIDGLHFDYIRYPNQNSGFNQVALDRYNQEHSLSGKPVPSDPLFSEWRRRQVTDWLCSMYLQIIQEKPNMKVSAATFASRLDAYNHRFQDWAHWMKKGFIDANISMNYSRTNERFEERVDDILKHSYSRHVYMGVGAYLLPQENTIEQLNYARKKGSAGLILFSYANNNKQGKSQWLESLQVIHKEVLYQPALVPDMPWKKTHSHGHIWGQVMDSRGQAIYNADIHIPVLGLSIRSDSLGYFGFLQLPLGNYTLVYSREGKNISERSVFVTPGKVTNCSFRE